MSERKSRPTIKVDPKKAAIRKLEPESTGYDVGIEGSITGFIVRVYPSGKKSFALRYKLGGRGGRKRRAPIGDALVMEFATARQRALELRRMVEQGIDPVEQEQAEKAREESDAASKLTVAELADLYIELHAKPNKRSWAEDRRQLDKDVIPRWGKRTVRSITRADVNVLLDEMVKRGASVGANRMRRLLSRMFKFAAARDLVDAPPTYGVEDRAPETQRERMLDDREIKTMLGKLAKNKDLSETAKDVLRMCLLTGQRIGEVAGMRWDEIDRDFRPDRKGRGVWEIPAERVKVKRTHAVPLTALMVKLLDKRRAVTPEDCPFVFEGRHRGKPITAGSPGQSLRKIAKDGKLLGVDYWSPHDLRRSVASGLARLKVPRLIQSKVLNHSVAGVTERYDRHDYHEEKLEALEKWNKRLLAITEKHPW